MLHAEDDLLCNLPLRSANGQAAAGSVCLSEMRCVPHAGAFGKEDEAQAAARTQGARKKPKILTS